MRTRVLRAVCGAAAAAGYAACGLRVYVDRRNIDDMANAGLIRKRSFDFGFDPAACAGCCGTCCRGLSGNIWVNEQEIEAISSYLGINSIDFISRCTRKVDNRTSIRERHAGDEFRCIFLETGSQTRCSIYPVRPRQCRSFPFWEHFGSGGQPPPDECPGIVRLEIGGVGSDQLKGR